MEFSWGTATAAHQVEGNILITIGTSGNTLLMNTVNLEYMIIKNQVLV